MTDHELNLQKKAIKAVQKVGGNGMKMSHRFLVGIPDLLMKLPDCQTCILEAKQKEFTSMQPWTLPVTPQQLRQLRDWAAAGTPSGVLSFVRKGKEIWAAIYPPPPGGWVPGEPPVARFADHFLIDRDCSGVVGLIRDFVRRWP